MLLSFILVALVVCVGVAGLFVIPRSMSKARNRIFADLAQKYNLLQSSQSMESVPKGTIIIRAIDGRINDKGISIMDCYVPSFFRPTFLTSLFYSSEDSAKYHLDKMVAFPTSFDGAQTKLFINGQEEVIKPQFLSFTSFVSKEALEDHLNRIRSSTPTPKV